MRISCNATHHDARSCRGNSERRRPIRLRFPGEVTDPSTIASNPLSPVRLVLLANQNKENSMKIINPVRVGNTEIFYAGAALSVITLMTIAASPVLFFLGLPYALSFPSALLFVSFLVARSGSRSKIILLVLVFVAISIVVADLFYDLSADGRVHLQETIIQLDSGWNFLKDDFPLDKSWWGWRWSNDYPLGMQFFAVSLFSIFDNIQVGKSFLFLMLFSCALMFFSIASDWHGRGFFVIGLCTIGLVFNPIVIGQLWTFYVDGFIYLVFVSALLSVFRLGKETQGSNLLLRLHIAFSIASFPAIKLSGIVFSVILFVIYLLSGQFSPRRSLPVLGFVFIFSLLMCFKPYLQYSIPSLIDIAQRGQNPLPRGARDMVPPFAFLKNLFSVSIPAYSELRFGNSLQNLRYDSSFGLYGYAWALAFFLSLILWFKSIKKDKFFRLLPLLFLPAILYDGFANQRYFAIPYIFPFFVFVFAGNRGWQSVGIGLLLLHLLYLSVGFSEVYSKNIDVTAGINAYQKRAQANYASGRPTFLEFQDSNLSPIFLPRAFSDRLWVRVPNTYILNHEYNVRQYSRLDSHPVLETIEVGERSATVDLLDKLHLTVLEIEFRDRCPEQVSIAFSGAVESSVGLMGDLLLKRWNRKGEMSATFAIPPNGVAQINSRCVINRILVRDGRNVKLLPTTVP